MIRQSKITCFVVVLTILATGLDVLASAGQRRGTAGAQELLIPVGSRGTALNGAFTSGIDGIEAIYWNPAGLAISEFNVQAMFSRQNYLLDMAVNYGAVSANFKNVGAIGLSIKSFDFGTEIAETTVENPDGTGRTFSPIFLTLGLTYARQMTDRITFGTTLKVISEQIINAQATGYAFDFGLQYFTGLDGLKLGFALKNFGPRMAFSGPDLEYKVQIPGTEAGADEERLRIQTADFDLPSQFELGASYLFDVGEQNALTVMGVFQDNSFSFNTYNLAAEYSFNNWVFLRASYTMAQREGIDGKDDGLTSSNEDYLFGPAFGAGIKLDLSNSVVMNMDYAYRAAAVFNEGIQWFTITFGL
jgi:hypothetical protein